MLFVWMYDEILFEIEKLGYGNEFYKSGNPRNSWFDSGFHFRHLHRTRSERILLLSEKRNSRLFVSASLLLDGGDVHILDLCGCTGLARDGGGRRMMSSRLCWNAGLENLHFGLSPPVREHVDWKGSEWEKGSCRYGKLGFDIKFRIFICGPQVENQRDVKSNSISCSIPKQHYTSFPNIVFD